MRLLSLILISCVLLGCGSEAQQQGMIAANAFAIEQARGIDVKYSCDDGTGILGSATGPLKILYGHFTDIRTIEIAPGEDAAVVARRVVVGQSS